MIYLLSVSWLFIRLIYSSCPRGDFEVNPSNNACMFQCDDDNTKYIAKSDVTFTQLKRSCGFVQYGSILGGGCSSTSDLVWSDSCKCPYCKCSIKDETGSPQTYQRLVQRACWNCTCDTHSSDSSLGDQLIYSCDRTTDTNKVYNWDDYSCPAGYCLDDDGDREEIGESWWGNVDVDEKCTKFCYCGAGSTKHDATCITGFDKIIASTNEGLKGSFLDECENNVIDCWNEPSRMFTTDIGPSCDSCPKCNCGSHEVDDEWWTEYDGFETQLQNTKTCVQCTCRAGSTPQTNYADCFDDNDAYSYSYPIGAGSCPGSTTIKCHKESGGQDSGDNVTMVGTLNSQICKNSQPEAYCSFDYDPDLENDESNEEWDWGCDSSPFCAVWGGNNKCIFAEGEISYTDCDGSTEKLTFERYLACCNDEDNCNYQSYDLDLCTKSTGYSELFEDLYGCIYSAGLDDECDEYDQEMISCGAVQKLFKTQGECYCGAYSKVYDAASSKWKTWIKQYIDMFFTQFSRWNDALGCKIELGCDLTIIGGNVYGDKASDNKIYFLSTIVTIMVVMIINI